MNLTAFAMRTPYTVLAVMLAVVVLGGYAFFRTPTDLFPNAVPPQVIVITVEPGAAAADIADKITQVIEKELNTIGGLKKILSTSRDEVSSINAEFVYSKPLGEAVLDVQSVIGRIRADLPGDILEPRIYRVTDATRPLVTLALTPKKGSTKSLRDIRLLADNEIMDEFLALPGVADVDVFGGHQPEVKVRVDRDRLTANRLSLGEVISTLAKQNITAPAGTIYSTKREYLVKTVGEFRTLDQIRDLPLRKSGQGWLRLRDVATVFAGVREQRSVYHGNGRPAIAMNLMRPEGGATVSAIEAIKALLPKLEARYPDIGFELADDQQPIIDINVRGMRSSLVQAVVLTVLVILVFLADFRAALVVSVSIPLAFLASLVVLWFSPYTLNMVTLSGLIIAVGMVVDAAIVVIENIYRHYAEMEVPDARRAAREGASEVGLAITAGMLTTVIVLIPVMFVGGYPQRILRPLNIMISSTLVASLVVALAVIPLLAARLLGRPHERRNPIERFLGHTDKGVSLLAGLYIGILRKALRWRVATLALAVLLLVVTRKVVVPLIGGELMPFMDTGIVLVDFDTPTDYNAHAVEEVLDRIERMIYAEPGVLMVSSVVGSEPGQISFGGGGATAQSGRITINLEDRTRRSKTIWDIEDDWRAKMRRIPGVRTFRVSEYGATPVSTTKAPLDLVVSGADSTVVSRIADQCLEAIRGTPGLVDVRRSWYFDKVEHQVTVDPALARLYRTSPGQVAFDLKTAVRGVPVGRMRLDRALDIPIRVQYAQRDMCSPNQLGEAYISTPNGPIPLRATAAVTTRVDQPFITREQLRNTIDVTGGNRTYTIKQVAESVRDKLAGIRLPAGYRITVSGTDADMKETQLRLAKALALGIVLLYMLLLAMFKSFRHPVTIMASIPVAAAGSMWGLLFFDKPMCMPAMMGLILLGGTIVNNSILLLDFILAARARGVSRDEAIIQSVRLRIRPILMTTVSTIVGLTPLILEMAVGLERMSPLGIVAAAGLAVGTFLTMILTPVVYSSMESVARTTQRLVRLLLA
ncbi:MAG: efflux RND transporter permease subunit [Kiritimatiellaeota bacterium]|nr:efflux RND transporter permease subunit [Kiritimatiellota bacterium]